MCNRCNVTIDYLAHLDRALSGNPNFNGKCGENMYWILEMPQPTSYHREKKYKIYKTYSQDDGLFEVGMAETPTTDFMLRH